MKTMRLFGFVVTVGIQRERELPIELTCVRCGARVSDNGEYYCAACLDHTTQAAHRAAINQALALLKDNEMVTK